MYVGGNGCGRKLWSPLVSIAASAIHIAVAVDLSVYHHGNGILDDLLLDAAGSSDHSGQMNQAVILRRIDVRAGSARRVFCPAHTAFGPDEVGDRGAGCA
jgi:hypothetical protein